ncbi:MAG: hypothetical protein WD314_11450 [Trueperaceae bacterium]
MGECKLGLLDGLGGLTLVRDASGAIVRGRGAWRPHTGSLGYDDLRELFRPGAALTYQGPACDETAEARRWDEVSLEVEITAVERCGANTEEVRPSESLIRLEVRASDEQADLPE